MNGTKIVARELALVAALAGAGAQATAFQAQCGDGIDCGPDSIAQEQQLGDSTGVIGLPEDPLPPAQQPVLEVAKFDKLAAAALNNTTPDKIRLLHAEVALQVQPQFVQFLYVNNPSVNQGDCVLQLDWLHNTWVEANAEVGTPQIDVGLDFGKTSPTLSWTSWQISDGGSPPAGSFVDWQLDQNGSDAWPGNVGGGSECVAKAVIAGDDLGAFEGAAGEVLQWRFNLFGDRDDSGCQGGLIDFEASYRADLTVTYQYCVDSTPPPPPPPVDCAEGCTPGYWKNHTERWDGVGADDFTLSIKHFQSFNAVLGVDESQSGVPDSHTLLDAASTGGGGIQALNRHTAAALPSSDTAIFYGFTTEGVVALYQDAVGAVAGPETISSAHSLLEEANEAGCPLSNDWVPAGYCAYCFADEGDCPCGGDFLAGGCKNSTGQGAALTPSGSSSHAADDLVLTASGLPGNVVTIYIMAPEATRSPLNDGNLCVSPGNLKIIRFAPQVSSAGGFAVLGPGIVQQSIDLPVDVAEIFPGDTWNFQVFYRDRASTCGGGSNLSNAVQVHFF